MSVLGFTVFVVVSICSEILRPVVVASYFSLLVYMFSTGFAQLSEEMKAMQSSESDVKFNDKSWFPPRATGHHNGCEKGHFVEERHYNFMMVMAQGLPNNTASRIDLQLASFI